MLRGIRMHQKEKVKAETAVKKPSKVKSKTGVKKFSQAKSKALLKKPIKEKSPAFKKVSFYIEGLKCGGRLYLPEGVKKPPVIIMAQGLGAEMNFGIPAFAEEFIKYNFAVFTFDYRYFGDSEGEPRHYISPKDQKKDWDSAIQFVNTIKDVDSERKCIWGFSYGGGHVIVAAAKNNNLKGFIAHMPFMDSLAIIKKNSIAKNMKINISAVKDIFNSIIGRPPYSIPVIEKPENFAVLNTPESYDGYMSMIPEDSMWKNEMPARSLFNMVWYRPIKFIPEIRSNGLIIFAEFDSYTDADMIENAFRDMPHIEILKLNCGHFQLFEDEYFRKIVSEEIRFLRNIFK
jgi:pimeloyl-ACP methyl ester carboxylesterase